MANNNDPPDRDGAKAISPEKAIKPTETKTDRDTMSNIQTAEIPVLDRGIQGALGRQLRDHYNQLVNEKVPDQLLNLLDELARKEHDSKKD